LDRRPISKLELYRSCRRPLACRKGTTDEKLRIAQRKAVNYLEMGSLLAKKTRAKGMLEIMLTAVMAMELADISVFNRFKKEIDDMGGDYAQFFDELFDGAYSKSEKKRKEAEAAREAEAAAREAETKRRIACERKAVLALREMNVSPEEIASELGIDQEEVNNYLKS
jgi:DNA-directed RNA polymerase specialized sigma24 family protein